MVSNFILSLIRLRAPLASPTFTGIVTIPTPAPGDNTTAAASTAFVTGAIAAGVQNITNFTVQATPYTIVDTDQGKNFFFTGSGAITQGTLTDAFTFCTAVNADGTLKPLSGWGAYEGAPTNPNMAARAGAGLTFLRFPTSISGTTVVNGDVFGT